MRRVLPRRWQAALAAALFGLALAWQSVVFAGEAKPLAEDPVVERRLNAIAQELRCLVCQNESLAASRADLAIDLRREIRGMIRAGKTDEEIMAFLTDRYGDFVRYRPPLKASTIALWFGPFVLLALALYVFVRQVRRTQRAVTPQLSEEERARAAALLGDAS